MFLLCIFYYILLFKSYFNNNIICNHINKSIVNVSLQINIDKFITNKTIKLKLKNILQHKILLHFVIQDNIKAFKGLTTDIIL